MTRRLRIIVCVCLVVIAAYVLFGELPFALRKTYVVYLHPDGAYASIGSPVFRYGVKIGYVHNVEVTLEGGVTIELRILEDARLRQSDVCVVHRLHRYASTTLHIEPVPDSSAEPLGDPPVLRCIVADGNWPEAPVVGDGLADDRQLRIDQYQLQLDKIDEHIERLDKSYDQSDEQSRRLDRMLERQEKQADRYDKILDRWEKQSSPKS